MSRDLKATIAGAVLAGLYALQDVLLQGASISDWKTYVTPVAIATIGYLIKPRETQDQ